MRFVTLAAAPFQVLVVAGCNSWWDVGQFMIIDGSIFASKLVIHHFADDLDHTLLQTPAETGARQSAAQRRTKWLRRFVRISVLGSAKKPLDWPSLSAWRRYELMTMCTATTGATAGVLAAGTLIILAAPDLAALDVFLPRRWTSISFIVCLMVVEYAQVGHHS